MKIFLVFNHYISLHESPLYEGKHEGRSLPETDRYTDCVMRLSMFYQLEVNEVVNTLVEQNYDRNY